MMLEVLNIEFTVLYDTINYTIDSMYVFIDMMLASSNVAYSAEGPL